MPTTREIVDSSSRCSLFESVSQSFDCCRTSQKLLTTQKRLRDIGVVESVEPGLFLDSDFRVVRLLVANTKLGKGWIVPALLVSCTFQTFCFPCLVCHLSRVSLDTFHGSLFWVCPFSVLCVLTSMQSWLPMFFVTLSAPIRLLIPAILNLSPSRGVSRPEAGTPEVLVVRVETNSVGQYPDDVRLLLWSLWRRSWCTSEVTEAVS